MRRQRSQLRRRCTGGDRGNWGLCDAADDNAVRDQWGRARKHSLGIQLSMRNRAALLCFLLSAAPAFAQAKCDSNGTPGNGTDDRAAFQAAFDSVDPLLGGAVLIPAGKICRISDYIHVHASNLTITGGGTLFADPPIVNGQL